MNTDTGQVYRTKSEIDAAFMRGEPLVPVSEDVADAVEAGMALNRHERRRLAAIERRARKRGAR